MLTYKAMYKYLGESVHAEVLDFPGVITCGGSLEEARRLLGSALVDMALWCQPTRSRTRSRSAPSADRVGWHPLLALPNNDATSGHAEDVIFSKTITPIRHLDVIFHPVSQLIELRVRQKNQPSRLQF